MIRTSVLSFGWPDAFVEFVRGLRQRPFWSRAMDIPYRSRGFVRYNLYCDSPFRNVPSHRAYDSFVPRKTAPSKNSMQLNRLQDLTSEMGDTVLASPLKSSSLAVWHMKRCVGKWHNLPKYTSANGSTAHEGTKLTSILEGQLDIVCVGSKRCCRRIGNCCCCCCWSSSQRGIKGNGIALDRTELFSVL